MKYISLILLITLTSCSALLASGNPEKTALDKAILKIISYPAFAKESRIQGFVLVEFEVDVEGHVRVKQMNASHPALSEYVRTQLEKMLLKDIDSIGIHYAKFYFRHMGS